MRLHRLTLRHFRGVTERELAFDESGVTVVVGDNETGKSSMLEALGMLFALRDDSKAARLRAVQPVGRDVATEVEAEIGLGESRLYYRKRWFRQRATELRVEPGGATWIGREAHDEAARRFGEHVDATLWAALAVEQEDSLVVPAAGTLTSVLTALDEVAGGEVDHGAAAPLVSAVEREYLRYFTPTGRPTGEFAELARRREDARAEATEAENRLADVEQDVTRAEGLRRELGSVRTRAAEQASSVAELEARHYAVAELTTRVERLRRDVEVATERRTSVRGDSDRRKQLLADVAQREAACATAVESA
ncbi:MAG TPA: AAA family ATPase, partial [Actinopolymorphaceae bacterium]|nr:AAA family ATPase [Actinopolymorphaceae bacterium]